MIIRSIYIKNLGSIRQFALELEEGMNLVRLRESDEMYYAISMITNRKAVPLPYIEAREDTAIRAAVDMNGKRYHVILLSRGDRLEYLCLDDDGKDVTKEYLYSTRQNAEQDLCSAFCREYADEYPTFLKYVANDRFHSPRELSRLTDGQSDIKYFRAYLRSFIKNFKSETIREGKRYEIFIDDEGCYSVRYRDSEDMPVLLSETENTLFRYLSFLNTARFWSEFESIRNMHSIKKPFIIKDFLERIDEAVDTRELLMRTMEQGRQVIVLR